MSKLLDLFAVSSTNLKAAQVKKKNGQNFTDEMPVPGTALSTANIKYFLLKTYKLRRGFISVELTDFPSKFVSTSSKLTIQAFMAFISA